MIPLAILLMVATAIWLKETAWRLETYPSEGVQRIVGASVGFLIGAIGLWALGNYQQRHVYSALLDTAARHQQQQNWPWAASYLQRYLRMNPRDPDAYAKYTEASIKSIDSANDRQRSIALAYRAWQLDHDRADLAAYAAETAFDLGVYRRTMSICEELFAQRAPQPTGASVRRLYADAMLQVMKDPESATDYGWEDLADALELARRSNPKDIRFDVALARVLYSELVKPDEATRLNRARDILDDLVARHRKHAMAWLARYEFFRDFDLVGGKYKPEEWSYDIEQALRYVDSADAQGRMRVYLSAAEHFTDNGNAERAVGCLRDAIGQSPSNAKAYVALAELKRREQPESSKQDAVQILHTGLAAVDSDQLTLLLPLASLQVSLGNWDDAQATLEEAEQEYSFRGATRDRSTRLGIAIIAARIANYDSGPYAAIERLSDALSDEEVSIQRQRSPGLYREAYIQLARFYQRVGMWDRASEQFRLALQLGQSTPQLRIEAAHASLDAGDLEFAELQCRRVLQANPTSHAALIGSTRAQLRRQLRLPVQQRDWKSVQATLSRARDAGAPATVWILANAELLEASGEAEQAKQVLLDAVEQGPDEPALWQRLAMIADRQGELEEAKHFANRLLQLQPISIQPNVLMARLLEKSNQGEQAAALLDGVLGRSTAAQWVQAAYELARLQLLLGNVDAAKTLLVEAGQREPENLLLLDTLASLAWLTGEWEELEQYEQRLHRTEGESGTIWRFYQAVRYLAASQSTDGANFRAVLREAKRSMH